LAIGLTVLTPKAMFACAACYGGNIDAPMADGMNWAILTLGVVITTVLGAFLTFLIRTIRKSEALEVLRQQAAAAKAHSGNAWPTDAAMKPSN
jgi:hypothetical protein